MSNELAKALAQARTGGVKLADYPGPAPADSEAAFALQCEAAKLTGWRQTGWKIGCTSQMAQKMLRTDSPFPGPVYAERTIAGRPVHATQSASRCRNVRQIDVENSRRTTAENRDQKSVGKE